ncbi:MAG TPA: hypothetical protein VK952_06200 [Methylotenera sp.]|nr:hypothetical protein [Methylotenera sp.]
MSKINPMQAAALNTPVKKIEPVKTEAAKPAAIKPAVTAAPAKTSVTKPAVKKAVPAKPVSKANVTKVAAKKTEKVAKEKTPKLKMERDSFTMPKIEYAQLYVLKERLIKLGQPAKKSELLRAGIMQLTAMTEAALKAAMSKVPAIKTGRPKKK